MKKNPDIKKKPNPDIEKYNRLKEEEGLSDVTIQNQNKVLYRLETFLGDSFKNPTEDEILNFFSESNLKNSSKNSYKGIIIPFYKWLFDWEYGDKLPPCIKHIKVMKKRHMIRDTDIDSEERIIKPEQYQKLIKIAPNIKIKAILETFNTFGIRRKELRSINADGIKEYNDPKWHLKLTIRESKTKPRKVPIEKDEYPNYLLTYWQQHPFKNKKGKPLFYSNLDKNGNPVRYSDIALTKMIKRLCSKAELKILHTPHDFRHTAISRDRAKGMPTTHIETKYGFIHGSTQIKTYDDNGNNELTNYILDNTSDKNEPETIEKITKERDKVSELEKKLETLEGKLKKYEELTEGYSTDPKDRIHANYLGDHLLLYKSNDFTPEEEKMNEFTHKLDSKNIKWDKIEFNSETNIFNVFIEEKGKYKKIKKKKN